MTQELAVPEYAQIQVPGVEFEARSLNVIDANLSFSDWQMILRLAVGTHSAAKFWIGDALNYGEGAYSERYAQAVEATGMDYHRLQTIASVCRKVRRSLRKEELSFSHHEVVARLESDQQGEWLEAAIANDWSVDTLRSTLRDAVPPKPRGEQPSWSGSEKPAPEVLTLDELEGAEKRARQVLETPLPAGHPLWETQARGLAADALSLAATARGSLRDVAARAVARAKPYGVIGFWIPRAEFEELVALLNDQEGGTP